MALRHVKLKRFITSCRNCPHQPYVKLNYQSLTIFLNSNNYVIIKLNSTFQTYKFDWAKNVTAAKLIEISSEYYLDIDVEDVKVMYWMVFGFNYNTTAPTIDDTSSSSGKSANLISVLEKSIESIYSSCGWFYLDVIHLETIRLSRILDIRAYFYICSSINFYQTIFSQTAEFIYSVDVVST